MPNQEAAEALLRTVLGTYRDYFDEKEKRIVAVSVVYVGGMLLLILDDLQRAGQVQIWLLALFVIILGLGVGAFVWWQFRMRRIASCVVAASVTTLARWASMEVAPAELKPRRIQLDPRWGTAIYEWPEGLRSEFDRQWSEGDSGLGIMEISVISVIVVSALIAVARLLLGRSPSASFAPGGSMSLFLTFAIGTVLGAFLGAFFGHVVPRLFTAKTRTKKIERHIEWAWEDFEDRARKLPDEMERELNAAKEDLASRGVIVSGEATDKRKQIFYSYKAELRSSWRSAVRSIGDLLGEVGFIERVFFDRPAQSEDAAQEIALRESQERLEAVLESEWPPEIHSTIP